MTDLLELAIKGHSGLRRWEQIERFRAATSITGRDLDAEEPAGTRAPTRVSTGAPGRCGRDRGYHARSTPWPGAQRYGQIRSRTS